MPDSLGALQLDEDGGACSPENNAAGTRRRMRSTDELDDRGEHGDEAV